ncbi:TPA: hypothetical protein DHW62_00200 [candidate division WWE3 bacterium]|uniref:Uncharacterized protein n=1 Tax=candidate division WWE3 bacterium TaxID=2053526 RepID=A0A656PLE5_UNCKA|nr:hypothetical protein P147_WWE3C00001G0229 [candidate division WWE3 bacterium RAAC2_WWE3_1]KKS29905.1 MAG: hypothetical protein UU91_C0003G0063 [candidate division WWE3 bacterium GW2011_GWB1_42_117]KKS55330.1 MAG: hypothetical protein UV21_C0002G0204 [candidate division WWE3 bacterium GW2011_GWD2_42_34]KKT05883.1 MAG: hypothetical protein UV83_C0001G0201 [candidate division WWE3 bacterium GW2011_GWE2_43_18]KKT07227.1 MAG: hypothetical protein UV84_C0001G0063 [candidate division WWE3 bacterium
MTKTAEDRLRELTISQLDPINIILNTEKTICTSEHITENLKYVSGKSLAGLNTLTKGNPPILKKLGKLSARSGYIWSYNKDFMPVEQAKNIVREVLTQLEEAGIIE